MTQLAVLGEFGNRIADVGQIRFVPMVGRHVSAGDLRAAFDQVPGDDAPASRCQSSHAQPNSCTAGPTVSEASATRPVMTIRAPPASASTIGAAPR